SALPPRPRLSVSIHAPARGATGGLRLRHAAPSCFNPRPRAGGDELACDLSLASRLVSIHAPARGATSSCCCRSASEAVSIHAPARGATDASAELGHRRSVSIHAPARGATRRSVDCDTDKLFQST